MLSFQPGTDPALRQLKGTLGDFPRHVKLPGKPLIGSDSCLICIYLLSLCILQRDWQFTGLARRPEWASERVGGENQREASRTRSSCVLGHGKEDFRLYLEWERSIRVFRLKLSLPTVWMIDCRWARWEQKSHSGGFCRIPSTRLKWFDSFIQIYWQIGCERRRKFKVDLKILASEWRSHLMK